MTAALQSKILVIPDLPLDIYVKNLPHQLPQAFGHLDRTRQGLRSTKKKTPSTAMTTLLPDTNAVIDPVIYVKDFSSH